VAASRERVRKCGRVRLDGDTVIRVRDGIAHYAGLISCGDVWVCPPCSAKIRDGRAREISQAAHRWLAEGHGLYAVTLTVPHEAGMPLGMLWSAIGKAMQNIRSGRQYQELKSELGIVASCTAKEVTHGLNGWHPHIHLLVFTTEPASGDGLFGLLTYIRRAWRVQVMRMGLGEPDRLHGVRVDECYSGAEAGLYLAKVQDGKSVGNEVARGDLKSAGEGHRTPFEILADLERYGLVSDRDLWAEYEQVMRGKRAIVWSRGYREILGMDPEITDEELAAAEVGGQAVAVLGDETWSGITRGRKIALPWSDVPVRPYTALLEAAERGGLGLVNELLALLGIPAAAAPSIRADDDVGQPDQVDQPDLFGVA
jgi:hypothetical protein